LNAYVGPLIDGYLQHLEQALHERGYTAGLSIVNSSGGIMSATYARQFPVNSMLSGPAAGVAAAAYLGRLTGYDNIITYDMGGTSTDVCLIERGQPTMTAERHIAGYPIKALQIDINTIGAGGGSIAWIDAGKILNVGPQSAGAVPGPVCYNQGGTNITVTDANVLLNRINSTKPLGGEIHLHQEQAQAALEQMAQHFPGLDTYRLADGIIKIAVTKMTGAIKEISIAKGRDPRDFVLFAYGGAGPMHATQIAADLGMHTIVVPPTPGNFSALGMLVSDIRRDYVRTRMLRLDQADIEEITALFATLEAEGEADMLMEGIGRDQVRHQRVLGMRYVGQSFELTVPWQESLQTAADVAEAFYAMHQERYHHSLRKPCEIVNFRLSTFGRVPKPILTAPPSSSSSVEAAVLERRLVYIDGAWHDVPVYQRDRLPLQQSLDGPAIVEEPGATTVITPGYTLRVDDYSNLLIERLEA
jgi:N-methylhydantoinase A